MPQTSRPAPARATSRSAGARDRDDLRAEIEALGPWFHNLDICGVRTAPDHFLYDYPAQKWRRFADALPDVSGKSVLDIGCNAGFHSFEMKRRGAARVLGIDHDARYLAQARFAAAAFGMEREVEFREVAIYDLADLHERFEIVLFLGVLYHLRHPLLALDLIREHVADDWLIAQSMLRGSPHEGEIAPDYPFEEQEPFDRPDWPKLHFIERAYAGDPTNWWAPNKAGFAALLRSAGFDIVAHPEEETFFCRVRSGAPA